MLNIFLSIFGASASSTECNWSDLKETVSLFHTGWAHLQACSRSFDILESSPEEGLGWNMCSCLVGFGAPILEQHSCELNHRDLLEWKQACSSKYCIQDNPEEFCYCNQDELKNVWKAMGKEVHEVCSDLSQEWNDGSHIFTQPTPHSCKCFHMMGHNKGQDLGCKWGLDDLSKPWEKSPSMASFAKKCIDKGFTEEDFIQDSGNEETYMKPKSRMRTGSIKSLHTREDSEYIHHTLFKILGFSVVGFLLFYLSYKCFCERTATLSRRRRKMVAIPSTDTIEDEEYGLDSEEDLEATYGVN